MNIALWLERAGRADPERPAIGEGRRVVRGYGELASRAARLAAALREKLGLASGDRLAIIAKNCAEYVEVLYGAWWAGIAVVPINAKLHGAEFAYTLEQSGARVCFATAEIETTIAGHAPPALEQLIVIGKPGYEALFVAEPIAPVERAPGDLAWLFYTSGTTGRPKGGMLTHGNLLAMAHAYLAEVDPTQSGDTILHAAPMSHGSGMYIMPHIMRRGINVVPESGAFDPAEIFETFGHWRRMSLFAAPTMVKRLVASPAECDPSAIRTIVYGGAPMYVEDARAALDRFGPCFAQIYGQGESPMTITTLSKAEIADRGHPRWLERLGSAGLPYACVEVAVVDQDDRPVPVGETGEVICRGLPVMPGYWVIGRPDPEWGEIIVAYVVGEAPPQELDRLCLSRIARFKRPKTYIFIEALPKNNYGKVLKTELRMIDRDATARERQPAG